MIRLATDSDFKLQRFAKAVCEGATIYAGPETAATMNAVFRDRGMNYEVIENGFVGEGELFAMAPSHRHEKIGGRTNRGPSGGENDGIR